jgi:hypothetical protein
MTVLQHGLTFDFAEIHAAQSFPQSIDTVLTQLHSMARLVWVRSFQWLEGANESCFLLGRPVVVSFHSHAGKMVVGLIVLVV